MKVSSDSLVLGKKSIVLSTIHEMLDLGQCERGSDAQIGYNRTEINNEIHSALVLFRCSSAKIVR